MNNFLFIAKCCCRLLLFNWKSEAWTLLRIAYPAYGAPLARKPKNLLFNWKSEAWHLHCFAYLLNVRSSAQPKEWKIVRLI